MQKTNILIIGAGLTGLTLAYLLKKQGINALLLEARNRIGGRILTNINGENAPVEMGATWFGKKHTFLVGLLKELGLPIFEQRLETQAIYEPTSINPPQLVQLPPNDAPSYRIAGGSVALINALASRLKKEQIRLSTIVKSIELKEKELVVTTDNEQFTASKVISTLPPYLLVKQIKFQPALPAELLKIANKTHTWMGNSIKVGLRYKNPFWRAANRSGTIFSNVGPVNEMYDHSNIEDTKFALKGFMNPAYFQATKEQRLQAVLNQLKRYFGEQALRFEAYEETVWRKESFTFTDYNQHILPHENNGHPIYQQAFLNDRFFIGGSETAPSFGGYMDGAVHSGIYLSQNSTIITK